MGPLAYTPAKTARTSPSKRGDLLVSEEEGREGIEVNGEEEMRYCM